MNTKSFKKIRIAYFFIFILLAFSLIFISVFYITNTNRQKFSKTTDADTRSYHIIITGSYENQLFLQQVYEGARLYSDQYNAVVELYVPGSQAEDIPLQSLLDYVSFVNADGVIAFNDSPDKNLSVPYRTDNELIPLVTTGLYNPNLHQISYIGTSYWELGKKIGQEINFILHGKGNVIIIGDEYLSNINYSNLMNSLLDKMRQYKQISFSIIDDINNYEPNSHTNLLVCLTEEDTIKTAQHLLELEHKVTPGILGFGTNETCQLYLEKGIVTELVDVDPKKIGETALRELFEYRNKGYANSYIAADVKILRRYN